VTSGDRAQKLILRGGRSAAIGLVIRLGARILFLLVAARLFGALLFGAYSLAIAVVELGVAVAGLGMKRLLFKLLDEAPEGRAPAHIVLDAALAVTGVGAAIAAGLMLVVALPPVHALLGETAWPLLLVAPMIVGQALLDLFLAATRWKHRMRYEVVGRSIVEPYAATAAAVAAYFAGFTETGLLVGYWAGTLLALAYAAVGLRRCFGGLGLRRYRPARLRAILHESAVPTLGDFTSALFGRLDLYLIGLFLGESPAGIYNVARQVRTPIRQVRQSFDGMLTPIVARTLAADGPAETGAAIASASRLILAIQLAMVVSLVAVGLPLLGWFGPAFAAGYWALLALALAETIQGAFGIGDLIFLYRQPWVVLRITAATTIVNLAAGLALIPWLGIDGAALSVLAAMIAGAIIRRWSLRARFGVRVPLRYSAGPVLAAGLAMLAALGAKLLAAPEAIRDGLSVVAALIVYAAALRLWLAATGDSLALVKFRTD
jgi:O-antigen/teichoic acid export membrane protein